ncbi:MAG: Ig-like domain-containing protein [bacterium]
MSLATGLLAAFVPQASAGGGGPEGYTWCASESQSYTFTQTADVAYGANGMFAYMYGVTGTIVFNNATFGDPINGESKAGYYKVVAGNQPPTANAQAVTTAENTAKAITLTGSDPEGSNLTYTVLASPAHGTLSGTGASRTYTPAANYNGSDSFTFKVNDGALDSAVATVSITVTAANDAPTVTASGSPTSGTAPLAVNFTATGADVDGDALTYAWTFGDGSASSPQVAGTASHTYAAAGTYTATVTVSDGHGGTASANVAITVGGSGGGGPAGYTWCASESQSYTFTQTVDVAYGANGMFAYKYGVTGTIVFNNATFGDPINGESKAGYYKVVAGNQPPTANAQAVTTAENTAKAITLTGSDPEGSNLTYTVLASPAHGTLSGTGASRTYTPAANYNGSDSFTFKVNDGALDSAVATVSITVTAANDAPTVTASGSPTSGTAPLAVNFTATGADVDGDALTYAWTFGDGSASSPQVAGTASHTYAAVGTYTATVTVSDPSGASGQAAVTISVTAQPNRAPVANAQSVTTAEDTAKAITLAATDADNDALTYVIVANPAHGTLSGTGASRTYTPDANYSGADSFTFRASDPSGASGQAAVSITVTAVNDAPTVTASGTPTSGTAPLAVNFTATGADVDGDALTYAWNFGDGGTASVQNPSHTYASAGSYTSYVTVSDGKGGTASANVAITVTSGGGSGGVSATGGYVKNYTLNGVNYRAHIFASNGTLTVTSGGSVEYLIVGGGGAGGNEVSSWSSAGGGGGGVLGGAASLGSGGYAITVGAGGINANGGSSVFNGLSAVGGGKGGTLSGNGAVGGSGGGAGSSAGVGGLGTSGQGYAGGNSSGSTWQSAGGGGAGGYGGNAGGNNSGTGGNGGVGIVSAITGVTNGYAGGGGGGWYYGSGGKVSHGGGKGGGYRTAGTAGANQTGGGGGGAGDSGGAGGAGGSGIVIVRYVVGGGTVVSQAPVTKRAAVLARASTVTIPVTTKPNVPPVAMAGVDPANGAITNACYFWAMESYDPDGTIVGCEWRIEGKVVATEPDFLWTPATGGTYTVASTVWDNAGASACDEVVLRVTDDEGANAKTRTITLLVDEDADITATGADRDAAAGQGALSGHPALRRLQMLQLAEERLKAVAR